MNPTLYEQIEAIAAPIVKHYHDDVRRHDFADLAKFQIGDSALWACYDCGSHMVRVSRSADMTIGDRPAATRGALNWFDAVNKTWPGVMSWHLLESTGGFRGKVRPVSETRARSMLVDKIRDLENGARCKIAGAEFAYAAGVTLCA